MLDIPFTLSKIIGRIFGFIQCEFDPRKYRIICQAIQIVFRDIADLEQFNDTSIGYARDDLHLEVS